MDQDEEISKVKHRIKELKSELHTAACDISFWREQQEDTCKKVKELAEAAAKVFHWYYIFGEDREAAKTHLAHLGNILRKVGY